MEVYNQDSCECDSNQNSCDLTTQDVNMRSNAQVLDVNWLSGDENGTIGLFDLLESTIIANDERLKVYVSDGPRAR